MIDRRLVKTLSESRRYIVYNVLFQWIALLANVVMMFALTGLFGQLYHHSAGRQDLIRVGLVILAALIVRAVCSSLSSRMSYLSSKTVKQTLRRKIYQKLLKLGSSYREQVSTSEVVQVAVEGVEQLETYFGSYLPQFFYALLAPLTLFVILCFVNIPAALVLLVCVPLIPVSIMLVQKWAKKLLSKYWGQYTQLGDTFLENLQGLTTLKIYQSDAYKNEEMNEESEKFRKITMRVLTMQLNSITIMDLIAYGGAALGAIMAVTQLQAGNLTLSGALLIILLAADFFIPMRQLGSFFHIAMNGMAASEKIFRLLDQEVAPKGEKAFVDGDIVLENVSFSYDADRPILKDITFGIPKGSLCALVGESGSGKSTIASLLCGKNQNFTGSITIGGIPIQELSEAALLEHVTYIGHNSYLFKGTVRENLLMADPQASDEKLWQVLERVNLRAFFESEQGLDTELMEQAANLSGGQAQRLALARGLLHDSPVYIFDEATSNIDVESENAIMKEILALSGEKTVLVISHRLANIVSSDYIFTLAHGELVEFGTHQELLDEDSVYAALWSAQQSLEYYTQEGEAA